MEIFLSISQKEGIRLMHNILRRRKLGMSSAKGIQQFSKENIGWYRNDKPAPKMNKGEYLFRWGCTSNVPEGVKVVNTAKAIHEVNNKREFRKVLDDNELSPKTWFNVNDPTITYPCVVRKDYHAQGRNMHLCKNKAELLAACRKYARYYITEYVDKVEEYRVAVVSGRAVWVAKKTPADPKALAWNVAKGGRFDNVRWGDWPLKAVKNAVEAFNLTTLDFGGVDVMIDKDGNATILEINSAPSLTSPYRQECMAKAFDYIVKNGTDRIPIIKEKGGYLKFIHPAVEPKAKLREVPPILDHDNKDELFKAIIPNINEDELKMLMRKYHGVLAERVN